MFVSEIQDDVFILRADTSLDEGKSVKAILNILGENEEVLAIEEVDTTVSNSLIEQAFDLDDLFEKYDLNELDIIGYKGDIKWQN